MPSLPLAAQALRDVFRFVIDGSVEAELVLGVGAFFGTTRDTDDAAALHLCDLSDRHSDRSAGARDDDRFTRLRATDIEQSEISSHAG